MYLKWQQNCLKEKFYWIYLLLPQQNSSILRTLTKYKYNIQLKIIFLKISNKFGSYDSRQMLEVVMWMYSISFSKWAIK